MCDRTGHCERPDCMPFAQASPSSHYSVGVAVRSPFRGILGQRLRPSASDLLMTAPAKQPTVSAKRLLSPEKHGSAVSYRAISR